MIARYVIFATASVAAHPAAAFLGRSCWLRSTQILLMHLATSWPPLSYRASSRDGQMLSNDLMRCDPSDSSETTSYQDQRHCARRSELREILIRAGNRFANIQTFAQSESVLLACCIRLCMARGGSGTCLPHCSIPPCTLFSLQGLRAVLQAQVISALATSTQGRMAQSAAQPCMPLRRCCLHQA